MGTPIPRQFGFTTCFVCGPDNSDGLHLVFERDGDRVVSVFTPPARYGGYGAILHGGLTSTLLDEAMCWAAYGLLGELSMTVELRVKFLGLLRCGEALTITGSISARTPQGAEARAEVRNPAGVVCADGTATLRFVSARAAEKLSR